MSSHINDFENSEYAYFKVLEDKTPEVLNASKYTVIRCDGNHFHSYTKGFLKPFDPYLHYCLDRAYYQTTKELLGNFWSMIYSQSDEVTIVMSPLEIIKEDNAINVKSYAEIPYKKKTKLLSIIPSRITSSFIINLRNKYNEMNMGLTLGNKFLNSFIKEKPPSVEKAIDYVQSLIEKFNTPIGFDCRIFQTDSLKDVHRCLTWRRCDAINNLKQMGVQQYYSANACSEQRINDMLKSMKEEYQIDWNTLPTLMKRGLFLTNPLRNVIHEFHESDTPTKEYEKLVIQ